MAQQDQLNISKFTKILVSDIKSKDSKLHQILHDIVNAKAKVTTDIVLADDRSPPHYWRVSVKFLGIVQGEPQGTLELTDIGTNKPK